MDWASAAEAPVFVELITKFTTRINELGPLGEIEGISPEELHTKLTAAGSAVKNVKLRIRFSMLAQDLRKANDHTPEVIEAVVAEKADKAIMHEMEEQLKALGA